MKVLCISVTPSPYQRDFFRALAAREECELEVTYLENVPDDSPWQVAAMEPWESVLPGRVFGKGRVRCHWNSPLPCIEGCDRVIVNAPLTGLTTQRMFRQLAACSAPPWVFWGELLLPRTGFRRALQLQLSSPIRSARAIVAIGRTAQADYEARFPGMAVHNIPYACDLVEFEQASRQRVAGAGCRFLFAGQMIERKGVDLLLEAFARLVADGLAVELHLVGREGALPGWLATLNASTRERVIYHGFVQPDGLPELFSMADVFVIPSRHDGWGVVVNQALGSGMPVVTSDAVGAGRDLVEDGKNGLVVPAGDSRALENAMRRLASDHDLVVRMADSATESAKVLTPEIAASAMVDIFNGIETDGGIRTR